MADRSWRRISTGKLNLLYNQEKVIPNYLKASTGSCHDFCKYGKKQEFNQNAKDSTLQRVVKIPRQSLDSPLMGKRVSKSFSSSCKPNLNGPPDVNNKVRRFLPGDVKKRETLIRVSKEGLDSVNNKIPRKSLDSPLMRNNTFGKRVSKSFYSSCKPNLNGPLDVNSKVRRFLPGDVKKREALIRVSKEGLDSVNKKNNFPKKMEKKIVSSSVMRKQKVPESSRSTFEPSGRASLGSRKITELNKSAIPSKLKSVAEKGILPERASFSRRRFPLKGSSLSYHPPLKASEIEKSMLKEDLVEEKTLYVIKMETENEIVESTQNKRCVLDSPIIDPPSSLSESTVIEAEDEDEDGKKLPKRERKNRSLSSEDAVKDKAKKLTFKRGKIVEAAPKDNSPRRLKFRRGRVLTGDDDSNPKSDGRKSLKTKGKDLNNEEQKARSMKVSLRHQDTQSKKDSRGLFNNVIEETASKLVETRKSKVKALVGAFETVISLQESKPSATQ